MESIKAILLLCSFGLLIQSSYEVDQCTPVSPSIDPSYLPKLPAEFQTRMEINILSENRSEELFVKFDYYNKKGEIIKRTRDKSSRTLYFFDKNELFYIEKGQCSALRLNESSQNIFFGLVWDGNTYNMQPSNYFFHFNNGFATKKLPDTTWRDIPASRYQSCQNWPEVNGNVLIDYYFSNPNHGYPITYNQEIKELPIAIMIDGYVNMNQPEPTRIKIEYNFFEFRTAVERRFDLFTLPQGVFCNGQTYKEPIPDIPESFSFSDELIGPTLNFETNDYVHYSQKIKATRFDFKGTPLISPWFVEGSYKAIHDFNSGIGYAVNQDNQNCLMYPIGTLSIDRRDVFSHEKDSESLLELKSPKDFFRLDDSYFYAGQRYERDILCDVFISRRTDITVGNITGAPIIFEFYFQNTIANMDQGNDQIEQVVPISIHATIEVNGLRFVNHFYNFDSELYKERFDISECFKGRDKVLFGMRFELPENLNGFDFERKIGRLILEPFEDALKKSFGSLEYSPLRIIPPKLEVNRNSFTINSGITATAPAINHFRKMDDTRIDKSKAKYTFRVDSPEKCASICMDKEEIKGITNNPSFSCRSFDFCTDSSATDFYCSFYNQTITDQDVVSQTEKTCNHYSKSTKDYDSATVDQLYGSLKEAILRKQFKIEYKTDSKAIIDFRPDGIFEGNQQQTSSNSTGGFGFTSFFERFDVLYRQSDFNDDFITKNTTDVIRRKSRISVDECARLCITEATFDCQSMTYDDVNRECKWSSVILLTPNITLLASYVKPSEDATAFIRDPLYNYIEYPYKVTALVDYSVSTAKSPNECAFACDKDKKLRCRSFNLCKQDDDTYRCLLSETNIHNTDKDPNVVYSAICSHYSKRAITDYELVVKTQLSVTPQTTLKDSSIESCAEICSFEDSFFCRSFDYDTTSKTCYLYEENLKDEKFTKLGVKPNENINHYSRVYYEEDGILKTIQAKLPKSSNKKYGGGAIFGIIIGVVIGGLVIGAVIGFALSKISNKSNLLPVMKFTNPNYENQS